jgi:hypothetical protein
MSSVKQVKTKKVFSKIALGSLIVLILLDLSPLGGNILTYVKWVQCGDRPLYARQGPGIGMSGVPNYFPAPTFGFMKGALPRYCTPREAELDGYSADPINYVFPHLSKQEQRAALDTARSIQSQD